ncbi:MAG: GNAT family N-acetyltransferase [Bacteroidota bacterium]|nr:GNAT family N-acetyltransferase [Bacteroidota bacterium]
MKPGKAITGIRMAVREDAADIAALLYESFIEHKSQYTEKAFAATTPGQEEIEDRIDKKIVWVAVCDNINTGTVSIWPRKEILHIRSMAVRPSARGKGIATALMTHIHELALEQDYAFLTLNTTAFLSEAIRLYERFGFERFGFDDLHGITLIKMIKSLEPITKNKIEKNDYAKRDDYRYPGQENRPFKNSPGEFRQT